MMKKFSNILSLIFTTIFILISINCYNYIINRYSDEAVPSINNYSSAMDYKLNFSEATSLEKVNYAKTSDIMVYPGGKPLGIKINTKGALVIALSDIEVDGNKVQSPAAVAGIAIGDSVIRINNETIKSAEDIATYVNRSKGEKIKVTVDRKGEEMNFIVNPVISKKDENYKIGLWVRDSVAGVGTLTFYHKESGKFGALGHPITDVDTNSIMTVGKGEIVNSNIVSVRKGAKGSPGELRGIFTDSNEILGKINLNTPVGVFGEGNDNLICNNFNKPMKVGFKDEVKIGKAQILTTIDGEEPQLFDIVIEKLLNQNEPDGKSMVIRVVDPICLDKTGGIIQGMSGSPIIQDNKIVGAVTHVLVNKPDTGYGIYMDWMINEIDIRK
ncbi:SpoIVB peptidase [Clostridium sp. UBA1056]|uniref:SpoIVB peptidase n=1 Tax=unclassified Clostridium TaxID=2614128 RepID=UPI0032165724